MMQEKAVLEEKDVRTALEAVERVQRQARRALAQGAMGFYLQLWGIIWFLGFSGTRFLPPQYVGWSWLALSIVGVLASFIQGFRVSNRVYTPWGARIAVFWLLWLAYGALFLWLTAVRGPVSGLFISIWAFFGYVVMGLWLEKFLLWVGLAGTALTLGGYLLWPDWFVLWMALIVGGLLFGSGVYIQRVWRK